MKFEVRPGYLLFLDGVQLKGVKAFSIAHDVHQARPIVTLEFYGDPEVECPDVDLNLEESCD